MTMAMHIAVRLRANHQPFEIVGVLPQVETGGTYDAHLTVRGGMTFPVTLDANGGTFPAWMNFAIAGTDIHVTGTAPGSAETDNFTLRVTDSSATPRVATSAQSVDVTAASSDPVHVQAASANLGQVASGTVSLASPAGAGHLLVAIVQCLGDEGTLDQGMTLQPGYANNTVGMQVFTKVATGGEQTFTVGASASTRRLSITVQEWSHAAIASVGPASALFSTSPYNIDTGVPPTGAKVCVIGLVKGSPADTIANFGLPAGWTKDGATTNANGAYPAIAASKATTAQETVMWAAKYGWKRYDIIWLKGA